jgi:transposase
MSRRRKEKLRPMTAEEQVVLRQIARAQNEPASQVARAKILLAVAAGQTYQAAAETAGRKSNDAVSQLVHRFNQEGLAALVVRHGGGPDVKYGLAERARILAEVRRQPDRTQDGTATWSVSLLQKALRQAPDGLPAVSTYTIWCVLREAGLSWQESRSWCETGKVKRTRKTGVVEVSDPDAEAKKN